MRDYQKTERGRVLRLRKEGLRVLSHHDLDQVVAGKRELEGYCNGRYGSRFCLEI